jgi:hypothetical protein
VEGLVRRRLAGVALVALGCAVVAAACGGGDGTSSPATTQAARVPVADWVGTVCTSVDTWQKRLTQEAPDISDPNDLLAAKRAVVVYLGKAIAATQKMVAEIKAAGVPDTDKGEEIASSFTSALGSVEQAFQKARSDTQALPTDDAAALAKGLESVGTDLTTAGTRIGGTFDQIAKKYPSADLGAAAQKNEACGALGSG